MLPILIGAGAVALASLFLEGCGGSSNEADASSSGVRDAGRDVYVAPQAPPNRPPEFRQTNPIYANTEQLVHFRIQADDADGDRLRYFVTRSQFYGNNNSYWIYDLQSLMRFLNPDSGEFSFTTHTQAGRYVFTFGVTDNRIGINGYPTTEVTVYANYPRTNHPPAFTPLSQAVFNIPLYSPIQLDLEASDPDNNALTFTGRNLPAGATFDRNPTCCRVRARFSWTPETPGYFENIHLVVSDGEFEAVQTIFIHVN